MQLNNFQIISLARSISFCQVSLSIEKFQVISILLKTLFHGLKLNPPLQMFLTQLKTSPREVRIRGTETESVPGFFKWSVNERGRGKLVAARNSGIFSLCASARRWPVSRASKPAPMFLIGPRSRAAILRVLLRNLHFARDPWSTLEVWIYRRKHCVPIRVYNKPLLASNRHSLKMKFIHAFSHFR